MNNKKLFQQVRILDPEQEIDQITDVLVVDNIIEQINPQINLNDNDDRETQIIDATGLILAPALVDLYSNSGEPGYEDRETLASLADVAQAGGFSRLAILPNTDPVVDTVNMVSWLKNKTSIYDIQFYLWGSLTQNLAGETIAPLADLAEAGVVGFTDNQAHSNLQLVRKLLEYAQPLNLPVALVPNQLQLSGKGVIREGRNSIRLGLAGTPDIAESVAIASLLEIASLTTTNLHLMRVSTARGVKLIQRAKEDGLNVTASVNWHHLLLNTQMLASYDPNLRFDPPLGREDDRLALIEGVKSGVIDAIAIDHQAYTYEENTVAFAQAPTGAIGLELALSLLWQNLITTGELTPLDLWRSLSSNPLKCLQQKPISLQVGQPAELVLFAPQKTWHVKPSTLKSRSSNTYWLNKQLQGKVLVKK